MYANTADVYFYPHYNKDFRFKFKFNFKFKFTAVERRFAAAVTYVFEKIMIVNCH